MLIFIKLFVKYNRLLAWNSYLIFFIGKSKKTDKIFVFSHLLPIFLLPILFIKMNLIKQLKRLLDEFKPSLWSKNRTLKRNAFLKVKGSIDTNLYFVESGSIRIFIEDEQEEHTIRLGYKGSFISALDSFISEGPSPFYIQALKACELKVISKQNFLKCIESNPENLLLWRQITEGLVYQQIEREIDILTYSPVERYKRVLKRSPHLFQEIPAKYIASYLRMTPETLSRVRKI